MRQASTAADLRKLHSELPPDVDALLAKMAKEAGIDPATLPERMANFDRANAGAQPPPPFALQVYSSGASGLRLAGSSSELRVLCSGGLSAQAAGGGLGKDMAGLDQAMAELDAMEAQLDNAN